jgi:hypothetical protein
MSECDTFQCLAVKIIEKTFSLEVIIFCVGLVLGGFLINLLNKVRIKNLKDRLSEESDFSKRYEFEISKIKLNTLYQITKISGAMTMEVPNKYNIKIFSSYREPQSKTIKDEMHDVGPRRGNFVMFQDVAKFLYLEYEGDEISHVYSKGL